MRRYTPERVEELYNIAYPLYQEMHSLTQVSQQMGIRRETITKILTDRGVEITSRRPYGPEDLECIYKEVLPIFQETGSITAVSRATGRNDRTVKRVLALHGVATKPSPPRRTPVFSIQPFLQSSRVSMRQLRTTYGSSPVKRWFKRGLDLEEADNLACRYGFLPSEIWDDWWDEVDRSLEVAA